MVYPDSPKDTYDFETIRKGVVQIKVYSQGFDAYSPWQSTQLRTSTGTGFILDKDRIITNAHVISNAKYVQVQRHNQTVWYEVDILHVAHDCDLALLKAKDPSFYESSNSFELGGIPDLNSPVNVVGYPIGGDKISVSRGIVSRKEQSSYAHSQVDTHLVIQVDAAINPGNSGGPAIQDGKVVGVAFQVATRGENIGYLIPTTVVRYFLKDVEDGRYDGYAELGVRTVNSFNTAFRKIKKIPDELGGVFVTKVLRGGSASGYVKKDDLIFEIDKLPIGRNGTVLFDKDARVDFVEVVDNKHSGEMISLKVFRDGKILDLNFPAKRMKEFDFMRHRYDAPFPYFVIGGIVFQPSNRDLLHEWSKNSETQGGSQFLYRFSHYIEEDLGKGESTEDVVFYRKLSHPVNSSTGYFLNMVLESCNDIKIKNIDHLVEILANDKSAFIKLKFFDLENPLILKRDEAEKADKEISTIYRIPYNKTLFGVKNEK
ncbi:MAG: trypsin-like peptidase domain-containing protein [Leptospiraceae bacterium]|nr:trypsin-like peptidase domain-containing protein [Leptospiraceae bacterium]